MSWHIAAVCSPWKQQHSTAILLPQTAFGYSRRIKHYSCRAACCEDIVACIPFVERKGEPDWCSWYGISVFRCRPLLPQEISGRGSWIWRTCTSSELRDGDLFPCSWALVKVQLHEMLHVQRRSLCILMRIETCQRLRNRSLGFRKPRQNDREAWSRRSLFHHKHIRILRICKVNTLNWDRNYPI